MEGCGRLWEVVESFGKLSDQVLCERVMSVLLIYCGFKSGFNVGLSIECGSIE